MASSRASTVACATSASMSICSPISKRRVRSSKNGGPTTTSTDRTRASTGSHQPSSQHAPSRGKTGTDSPYERGQLGEQVTGYHELRESAINMYDDANRFSHWVIEEFHKITDTSPSSVIYKRTLP